MPDVAVTLTDGTGAVVASTSTDSAGSFHFPEIEEGRYTVTVAVTTIAASVVEIGAGKAVSAELTLGTG